MASLFIPTEVEEALISHGYKLLHDTGEYEQWSFPYPNERRWVRVDYNGLINGLPVETYFEQP